MNSEKLMHDALVTGHNRQSGSDSLVIFFIVCVVFHLIGTWSVPLIDRDEPRFAEASREMIEGGDYVVPHFDNQLRLDKPPLAYWGQIASYKIFGENDFAARFPSAIAAALVALSILRWGKQIGGDRVGWWAAIIFTLSLQTFVHAKAAVADMWLVLFMTVAHWAGWELLFGKRSTSNSDGFNQTSNRKPQTFWIWWLIFYFSLSLGFLAKGPIAWTPLLTLAAFKFFLRTKTVEAGVSPAGRDLQPGTAAATEEIQNGLGGRFKFVRGTVLMLAIVSLWGIPALLQTHGEFLRIGIGKHVIGRSIGAMEGHGANSLGIYLLLLPFYLVTIFASFFPWSIKLPSLTRKLWHERDRVDLYLISGAGVIFVIFTLIKTKLPHYTLPAFPLLALLAARHIQTERFLKSAAIFAVCLYLALGLIAAPFAARFFPAKQLFERAKQDLKPEMEFAAAGFQEPSLVWYFRSRAKGWMTPLSSKKATEFMQQNGPRFVVLPTEMAEDAFPNPPANWKTFSASGLNIAKGKHVELTLVLKPE